MANTIAIANQKGGVGKTTTALALTAGLTERGYKTLVIDMDAQANLTYAVGGNTDGVTVVDILLANSESESAIQHVNVGDLIPGDPQLSGAEHFLDSTGKEFKLKESLESIADSYDFIIIDSPPSLGVLTLNSLTAADRVIIPAQADIFSLQGIGQLNGTFATVRKYCNPSLIIEGILLTRFNARTILSREVADMAQQMADSIGTKVFNAKIREGIAVKESQISKESLQKYNPRAKVTADYNEFIEELLRGMENDVQDIWERKPG